MRDKIPVYIISGFLGTGKTTVLNTLLQGRPGTIGVVQMEQGMTAPAAEAARLPFYTAQTEKECIHRLRALAMQAPLRELWLEWNGMVPFSAAEHLFLDTVLSHYYQIVRVLFVTTPEYFLTMMGKTGGAVYSQLAGADAVIVADREPRGTKDRHDLQKTVSLLASAGSNRPVVLLTQLSSPRAKKAVLTKKTIVSLRQFALLAVLLAAVYGYAVTAQDTAYDTIHAVLTYGMATLLQAMPFLLLGVLCSAALQQYGSPERIAGWLGGNPVKSLCCALAGGFLFPVCDCAAIPVFRSLLSRQVPLPAALLFMLSGPLINPVVIASTYIAFWGRPEIVGLRIGMGLAAALLVSCSFWRCRRAGDLTDTAGIAVSLCAYQPVSARRQPAWLITFLQVMLHSEQDFFRMIPYLIVGAFISAGFQVFGADVLSQYALYNNLFVSIELMLALAFFLSLCSTSDAMIARNLSAHIPLPGVMAFLIMGPMLDVKNFLLLRGLFPEWFVCRLSLTILFVCLFLAVVLAVYQGGIRI